MIGSLEMERAIEAKHRAKGAEQTIGRQADLLVLAVDLFGLNVHVRDHGSRGLDLLLFAAQHGLLQAPNAVDERTNPIEARAG